MPQPDPQSDDIVQEHLRNLERQQDEARTAFENGEIDEAEFNRRSAKLAFQVSSLQQRQEREAQQQNDRGKDVQHQRGRDIFGD